MAYFVGSNGIARRGALVLVTLVFVASVANCGGQSSRVESDDDGASGSSGDAGATSGGSPAGGATVGGSAGAVSSGGFTTGGVTTGGSSTGGSAGDPLDPDVRCRLPPAFGACRTRLGYYWFDAKTGLCMPFDYYGCSGNENRFASAEECYAVCGGRGDNDFGACETSAECWPKRLAEPCCSLDVQEFVGVNRNFNFTCDEPRICTSCAADCDYVPEDGYIGASCVSGHCIAFDIRTISPPNCLTHTDCYVRYGVECCADCSPGQYPSKLVALASGFDLSELACGGGLSCVDTCSYFGTEAVCSENHECELLVHPI